MTLARQVAGVAVALMTLSSFLGGAGLIHGLDLLPGACAWLAGLLLWRGISRFQLIQSLVMAGLGLVGIAIATAAGDWSWWSALQRGNHSMLAMLAAVSFLRLITDTGTSNVPLPRGPRAVVQTLIATHLFGAVINISAPVVIGERIAVNGRLSRLQTQTISRAFIAASMWSPFFIAMALILQLVPKAQFVVISAAGFTVSTLLMGWCAWRLPRDPGAHEFVGYPLRWQALWVPVLLSALVLGGHLYLPALPVLILIEGAALGMVLGLLPLLRGGRAAAGLLAGHLRERLPGMGSEISMFLGAAVMSAGIESAVRHADLALSPSTLEPAGAALLMAAMVVLAILGVHPVASLSALSSLWDFSRLDGNLLGFVFLMVWGMGLVAAPVSGTSLIFQTRFGLRYLDLFKFNGAYVGLAYLLSVAMLYAYEAWRTAG